MKVVFLNRFNRDLDKLTDRSTKQKIARIIEKCESAKTIYDVPGIKKMAGDRISYRIRLGDFRVGVYFENGVIEFARVVHRKDIYRDFP